MDANKSPNFTHYHQKMYIQLVIPISQISNDALVPFANSYLSSLLRIFVTFQKKSQAQLQDCIGNIQANGFKFQVLAIDGELWG